MRDYDKEHIIVKNDRTAFFALYIIFICGGIWLFYAYIGDEKNIHTSWALATAVACIVIPIKQIISEIKQKAFYTRIYNNKIESEFTYEKGKKIIWDIGKPYKVYWYFKAINMEITKDLDYRILWIIRAPFFLLWNILLGFIFFIKNRFQMKKYYVIEKRDGKDFKIFSVPANNEVKEYFGKVGFHWKLFAYEAVLACQ